MLAQDYLKGWGGRMKDGPRERRWIRLLRHWALDKSCPLRKRVRDSSGKIWPARPLRGVCEVRAIGISDGMGSRLMTGYETIQEARLCSNVMNTVNMVLVSTPPYANF